MERNNEINKIEKILKATEEFKKIDSLTIFSYKKIFFLYKNFDHFNFFNFVPKTKSSNSKNFLELAIELKGIEKSFIIKNGIYGISGLYFLLILDKKPKYLSFRTLGKFIFIASLLFYKNLENQMTYIRLFNEIYRSEFINLQQILEQENNGWNQEVNLLNFYECF